MSELESCYVETQAFGANCGQADIDDAGLSGVVFASTDPQGYSVTATSASGNTFTITKDPATNQISRSCARCRRHGQGWLQRLQLVVPKHRKQFETGRASGPALSALKKSTGVPTKVSSAR